MRSASRVSEVIDGCVIRCWCIRSELRCSVSRSLPVSVYEHVTDELEVQANYRPIQCHQGPDLIDAGVPEWSHQVT